MTYQAVFCDIDGTLLTTDHNVTDASAERIRQLSKTGIPFILVSARMPAAIRPIQERIGIKAPMICYGGALILDENGTTLESICLSPALVRAIRRLLPPETPDCCFCTYSGDLWLAPDRRHPLVRREEEITEVEARSVGPDGADALPESDIPVHKLLGFGPPALLDRTAETLRAAFPQCAVYKSAPHLLELMDGRVSKSGAVRRLCEKLGISPQKTVSFGDNYNDIDMLQATGLGIAMGNAPEAVKKAAGAVTADNDHEGLLKALNQLDFS